MSTLLLPTSGRVTVAGFDVERDYASVRPFISLISGGETSGYGILRVDEQLWMFSQFYGMETPVARSRIEHYLRMVGMWDDRRQQMNRLSTGMRQKVNLCAVSSPTRRYCFTMIRRSASMSRQASSFAVSCGTG